MKRLTLIIDFLRNSAPRLRLIHCTGFFMGLIPLSPLCKTGIIISLALMLPVNSSPAFAMGRISGGLYAGYQYDVAGLTRYNNSVDLQQNISAGCLLKIDLGFLFFRSGADFSYPAEKGTTTGNIEETGSFFVEVPVYAGLNLPLRNYGTFYMGGGGSYIFGMGSVETADDTVKINEQLFGYGFITGIESEISADVSFFFEWEYMTVKSSPVAPSDAAAPDDFCMDYSGSRLRVGAMYHLSRY